MNTLSVQIMNISDLPLPTYHSDGSAGMDFRANVAEPVIISPQTRAIVPTGIHVALPQGYELQIRGRSGLAAKYGISLVNGVGTIDSDYRGEIQVILINTGDQPFTINHGDRIAQGIVARYERVEWQLSQDLDATGRGAGGLGSTGRT